MSILNRIPTGADYHILCARSHVKDALFGRRSDKNSHSDDQICLAVQEVIKALELMRQEQEKKQHEQTPS